MNTWRNLPSLIYALWSLWSSVRSLLHQFFIDFQKVFKFSGEGNSYNQRHSGAKTCIKFPELYYYVTKIHAMQYFTYRSSSTSFLSSTFVDSPWSSRVSSYRSFRRSKGNQGSFPMNFDNLGKWILVTVKFIEGGALVICSRPVQLPNGRRCPHSGCDHGVLRHWPNGTPSSPLPYGNGHCLSKTTNNHRERYAGQRGGRLCITC